MYEKGNKKNLFHNMSSPSLLENNSENIKNKYFSNKPKFKNIKLILNRKLNPLQSSNIKSIKKVSLSNNPFQIYTRNKKNNSLNKINFELSGEIANENANKIMKKYFYPDDEKMHEIPNKLNEEIDINKMMSFYTKMQYNKEKEDIKKIIKKQKNITIFSNKDYSENDSELQTFVPSLSVKSVKSMNSGLKKRYQFDSSTSTNKFRNTSLISGNNCIKLDLFTKIYKSPLHSLDTMKKNKLIYNSIIEDYNLNRLNSFKKLENDLGPLLNLQNESHNNKKNNIKILPFIPRMADININNVNLNIKEDDLDNSPDKVKAKLNRQNSLENTSILNNGFSLYFSKFFQYRRGEKYLLKISSFPPYKNSPESRSQFIFVQEGKDVILHGGYNISRKYNIWKFNFNEKSWTSIEPQGLINEIRYAHVGALYHRNLYIYGGKYFRGINFADIEIFNLDKKSWIFPKLESAKRIPLRRNHASCSVGNTMFIHGGMNEDGKYLDDMYILNYKPLRWFDIDINHNGNIIPSLAHHCCCLVMPEIIVMNPKFNFYSTPEHGERTKQNGIKEKGIYIFGGKISNEGPLNNNLYVIKIGIKPVELIILKTYGKPPCPRFDFSMNFYEKGNILIIHGGRTIKDKYENGINDTFILDLSRLNWLEVEYFSDKYIVTPRYFHQSVILGGNLCIFGGMNGNQYIGSEMLVIDLDSHSKSIKEKYMFENQKKKNENDKRNSNKGTITNNKKEGEKFNIFKLKRIFNNKGE